jgi:hypothetical protein
VLLLDLLLELSTVLILPLVLPMILPVVLLLVFLRVSPLGLTLERPSMGKVLVPLRVIQSVSQLLSPSAWMMERTSVHLLVNLEPNNVQRLQKKYIEMNKLESIMHQQHIMMSWGLTIPFRWNSINAVKVLRGEPLAYTYIIVRSKYLLIEGTTAVKDVIHACRLRCYIDPERRIRRDEEVEGGHRRRNALAKTRHIAFPSFCVVIRVRIRRIGIPGPNLHGGGDVTHVDIEPLDQNLGAPC